MIDPFTPPDGSKDIDLFGEDIPLGKPNVPLPIVVGDIDYVLLADTHVQVRDTDGDVDSGIMMLPRTVLQTTAAGSIIAPEILAGTSDANGWISWQTTPDSPSTAGLTRGPLASTRYWHDLVVTFSSGRIVRANDTYIP